MLTIPCGRCPLFVWVFPQWALPLHSFQRNDLTPTLPCCRWGSLGTDDQSTKVSGSQATWLHCIVGKSWNWLGAVESSQHLLHVPGS